MKGNMFCSRVLFLLVRQAARRFRRVNGVMERKGKKSYTQQASKQRWPTTMISSQQQSVDGFSFLVFLRVGRDKQSPLQRHT